MPYTTFDSQKIYFVLVDLSGFSYLTPLNVKGKHSGCEFKGNAQFVQKVTFEPLMNFKRNHFGNWKYYKNFYF